MTSFSLGLIVWLCFALVYGKINKCYVGGIDEYNCGNITKGSVLQKFYISNFGMEKINACASNSLMQVLFMENDDEEHLLKSWNEVLDNGTDIYRLKFHNKLLNMYNKNRETAFTSIGKMLFIKSSYIAASIYFFINNQDIAYNVINDGIDFFYLVKDDLCIDQVIDTREVITWGLLSLSLKIDIMESTVTTIPYSKYLNIVKSQLEKLEKYLDDIIHPISTKTIPYPYPYVLMYRSYFLNEDLDPNKKDKISHNLDKILIDSNANHPDNKLFMMYKYLISAIKNTNSHGIMNHRAINNLFLALERPVLTIEDRLLNYKATIMMKDLYSKCTENDDSKENILYKDVCDEIEKIRENDLSYGSQSKNDILTKLTYLIMYDKTKEDIVSNIIIDDQINEKLVHIIFTMAIDMDTKSKGYINKIINMESTIDILNTYITEQEEKLLQSISESNKNIIEKNINTAYKWIIELTALLCNGTIKDKNGILRSLFNNAMSKVKNNISQRDIHLEYLIYKNDCKNAYKLFSRQNLSIRKTDGWILDTSILKSKSIDSTTNIQTCRNQCFKYHTSYDQLFINKTDLLIQLSSYNADTDLLGYYLIEALKKPVITSEDRYRNFEAHELYSMFLMQENNDNFKKNQKIKKIKEELNVTDD